MSEGQGIPGLNPKRRTRAPQPGFNGQNYVHTNPLPAVSNLPSFSYGSPQTALPQQPTARDTKIRMDDALSQAATAAKGRIEAENAERVRKKVAEQAQSEPTNTTQQQRQRQASDEPNSKTQDKTKGNFADREVTDARKRSLRSASVMSRDTSVERGSDDDNRSQTNDNQSEPDTQFTEGDNTMAEINSIIARNTSGTMLRNKSMTSAQTFSPEIGVKPRSAMKGSRVEALRPPKNHATAKTTATSLDTPLAKNIESTYLEEFSAFGGGMRSPSLTKSPMSQIDEGTPRSEGGDTTILGNSDAFFYDRPPDTPGSLLGNRAKERLQPLSHSLKSRISGAWYNKAKKMFTLSGYFVKHLLSNGLLALLLLLVVAGLAWSVRGLAGDVLRWGRGFDPSSSPPQDMSELSRRMVEVERHLKKLNDAQYTSSTQWKSYSTTERQRREALEKELTSMNAAMSKMQQSLDAVDKDAKVNLKDIKSSNLDADRVKEQLKVIQGKIDTVKQNIDGLSSSQKLNDQALSKLERFLPELVAAKIDPNTREITVAPELWRHLQQLVRQDMEEYAQKLGPSQPGKDGQSSFTWDNFLAKNEARLRAYVENAEDSGWKGAVSNGVIVSKAQMLEAMKTEMTALRSELEKDSRNHYKQIVSDAEKVAKSAAIAAASKFMSQSPGVGGGGAISKYGDAMIQAALHQYSAAVLQKPDYALYNRGTLIIPYLTSSSFSQPRRFTFSFLTRTLRNEPANALTESVHLGDAWTFPKSSGQLSLLLSEPVYPSDLTIDHIPKGISGDERSAPKDFEFWIKISDPELREHIKRAADIAIGTPSPSQKTDPTARAYAGYNFIRVAAFTYDIHSAYAAQTFEIPVDLKELGAAQGVEEVSFRILNNWGNEEYTSLYRVRIHGSSLDDERRRNEEKNYSGDEFQTDGEEEILPL